MLLPSNNLKNHGVDAAANKVFDMDAETMHLPMPEKMKFEQGTMECLSGRYPDNLSSSTLIGI